MWAKKKQSGFTIVELLIVVVVIAILAAITIVAYNGIQQRARASAMVSEVSQVTKKLETYKIQNNDLYPATLSAAGITESSSYQYAYTPSSTRESYSFDLQSNNTHYFATSGNTTPTPGSGSGLIAWWPYNGSPNDTGGALPSTLYGASLTTGQNGQTNTAYAFNGNNNYINSPGQDPIILNNNVGQLTISFWYNATHTNNSDIRFILSRRSGDSSSYTDYVFILTGGNLIFGTGTSGESCAWPDSSAPSNQVSEPTRNNWHYVVGTLDQTASQTGRKTVWVDGVKKSDCTYTNKSSAGNADLHVGTRYATGSGSNYFQGSLDDLRMYNRVLSDEEIKSLFDIGAQ
jgi:prepilin-type N-terminal cleavage/methylation domain-containing protein